ncbi:MAG: exopolysaccharide biosynthesis polyprenyl glycosylphosphotransferase [Ruminococcaceae bacterium]|nr:exopolysaccharide biosynthesis polyprenyl glycosylphosphotransferase [Oscillospiraceae bacterium]
MKKFSLKGIALNRSHLCSAVRQTLLFLEIAALTVMLVFTWKWFYNAEMPVPIYRRGYYPLALSYALLLALLIKALKGRSLGEMRVFDVIVSQTLALLIGNLCFYVPLSLLSYRILNPDFLIALTLVQAVFIVLWCFLGNRLFFYLFRPLEMLLISDHRPDRNMQQKLARYWERYHISTILSSDSPRSEILDAFSGCHAVLLDTSDRDMQDWVSMECFRRNLFLFLVPTIENVILHSSRRLHLVDTPILRTDSHRISAFDLFLKRTLDIAASALGLILSLPITFVSALAIRLGDGGPVFFRQQRLTRDGKVFELVKFRTMIVDAEKDGPCLAKRNDSRITPVGAVLRRTRLDELPQLWNVLKGDMSLVGPRPECPALAAEYEQTLPEFSYRLKVKAGITGMAQVYGNYATAPRDKLLMDLMYIEEYTFSLDLKLLLLTLRTLCLPEKTEGVEQEDSHA